MDSIGSVVARTINYVLIYILVRLIFLKVSISGQLSHNIEEGIQINKKNISTIFLVVAIFSTALFSYFSTLPSNVEGTTKLIVRMIGITFCVFCYMMSIAYSLWLIRLNNTEILYRSYLGKKSVIALTSVTSGHVDTLVFPFESSNILPPDTDQDEEKSPTTTEDANSEGTDPEGTDAEGTKSEDGGTQKVITNDSEGIPKT